MKTIVAFGVLLTLSACGGTSIATTGDPTRSAFQPSAIPVDRVNDASFGTLLNGLRTNNGAPAVTYNARLDQAAQAHADDMVARGYFAHTNPEGQSEYDRIVATGYDPVSWGENIAGRQQSEVGAMQSWINSPEHNRLLNAGTVDEFGLGVAGTGAGTRWVLVMASER